VKIDRLLSLVICLLNQGPAPVSAAKLAARFEVSKRTVLRDMERLALAGVPIRAVPGANGGYAVMEGYKLDGRLVTAEDRTALATALRGFLTAYDSQRYRHTLENVLPALPRTKQRVFFDFGASGERPEIQERMRALERAMDAKTAVRISYVNASGIPSQRLVEPLALNYRWYAWYLLAWCTLRRDYRVFKLARVAALEPTAIPFSREHGDPAELLERAFAGGGRKSLEILLLCKAAVRVPLLEYLDGKVAETRENGDFLYRVRALEDERLWFAMLLSFGDSVQVLEPEELKVRLKDTAAQILSVYPTNNQKQ